jgi:hypothetical protein
MKTFEILVRETRTAIYIVEADSADEAQELANEPLNNLDPCDEVGARDYEFRTVSVTEVTRYE